jgi:hypothetical protein
LYAKARRYLRDGRHRVIGAEVAQTVREYSARGYEFLLDLLDSEIVDDLVLCEGGVFEAFLSERDALLPADEAQLAARWSLTPRTLYEVEDVRRSDLALRDLRTGDRIVVTNVNPSDQTRPGWLFLGRPLPIEGTFRAYSGFVRIGEQLRDDVLAALDDEDLFALAALVGTAFARPTIQNTDGEPLVWHELTYRLSDPVGTATALRGRGLSDLGEGEYTFVRDDTVTMTVQITGDTMTVTANSDRRAADARLFVVDLPGATFEDDEIIELDELLDERVPGL